MRILFLTPSLRGGGAERQLTTLIKGLLSDKEFTCEVVVMEREVFYSEINQLPIKIHQITRKRKKDFSIFSKLFKIQKEFKPDIVHSWGFLTTFYALPLKIFTNVKLIDGSLRVAPSRNAIPLKRKIFTQLNFLFSDYVISNSNASIISYRAPLRKSKVIYNGFDLKRIGNLEEALTVKKKLTINDEYIIGMVATFSDYKDFFTFIYAASILLKTKNAKFITIGDGPNFEKCKLLTKKLGISDAFIFTGRIQNPESIENIFDIGVLASNPKKHGEGISNSLMEYMILGKPVVATENGGNSEIVINKKTGFLVPPQNPAALAEKLLFLIENDLERANMGILGKEIIKHKFGLEQMISNFKETYNEILKK